MKIEKIKCAHMKTDKRYQREANTARVNRIAREWKDECANLIYISRRPNGDAVVMDGNHTRCAAIKALGDDAELECKVFTGLSLEDEAKMFVGMNTSSKKPNYGETLKARVCMGETLACEYINALEEAGIKYTFGSGRNVLKGHKAMFELFKDVGYSAFVDGLKFAKECWENRSYLYEDSGVLSGLVKFVADHPEIDKKGFMTQVRKVPDGKIRGDVQIMRRVVGGTNLRTTDLYASLFKQIYNTKRRSGRIA